MHPEPAACLQVEILVELRAIHMERAGKMSRYGPLLILEGCKWVRMHLVGIRTAPTRWSLVPTCRALLKMQAWRHQYAGHLFLRNPGICLSVPAHCPEAPKALPRANRAC